MNIQYTDYTRWQSELVIGPEGEKLWDYWKRQLAGNLPVLNLPLDKPRTTINEQQGASQSVRFDTSLTQNLKQLSQQENATLYMTLLAVLQTLLYRYTGQDDFLIGSPTTGRSRAEFTDLMGYLVNPVVLRADLSGEPTFKQVLERVRQNVLAAFEHQEYPFALLVEKLQPDRTVWSLPLLQVMFVMQKAPSFADDNLTSFAVGESGGCFKLGESVLESISLDQQAALFDLTWTVAEIDGELAVTLQYREGLFEASTIRRMLNHFNVILTAVVESPDTSMLALPLMADAEEESLPKARHSLDEETPHNFCLQELFEEQVRSAPSNVAVSFEEDRLTYDELNRKANKLAHHLRGLGVGPEVLVGLFAERSLDLVVSILAILKAGGAYVPLDPSYPQERLAFMIADSGIKLLLTEQHLKERLPEHPIPIIFLDTISDSASSESDENPNLLTNPGNRAYVIYTSGSTGKPKGTEVTHANVTRLFAATDSWFQFGAGDVWTFFHSYAFDFSVWEIWGALLRGGRLVVVPYWISRSPEAFFDLLEQEAVTVLNQTPSAFRQLVHVCESFEKAKPLNLRLVIFGGEALDVQSLRPWFERFGDQRPQLVNMYGITETTVHVTYRPLKKDDLDAPGGSRIGVPIPDLQLHILDARMRPVPIGVVGEMYVGGNGVARGYLNRPEWTLERFLPDPFTGKSGARLYRTGDLARRLPGDDVEYIGRIDEQVKIRGFRIEMREIQLAVLQHPQVRDAVITVFEDAPGDKRLGAYVVPRRSDEPPEISELQIYLRGKLAYYMVPSLFVIIDELPLTPHGKLNRHALPIPEGTRSSLTTRFSAPATEAEALLAEIWTQILRVENIGIDDNFFDLGGDSIRSIQVKSRAEQRGLSFSIQQMFQNPTIRQLAEVASISQPAISQRVATQPFSLISEKDRVRLPAGLEDAYPLTKLQMGLVFHSERSADYETYVTSLHLGIPLDMQLLQDAVDLLVARHSMLRTSFNLSSYNVPLQIVHQSVSVRLKFDDLRHLSDEQQERVLAEFIKNERGRRFDWSQCPLFELHVHHRSENTLQFTLSEPFLDGWSVASLLTGLFTIYLSLLESGDYSSLPLQASFRDYVALEIEALQSSASREYWLTKMQGYTRRQLPHWPASTQDSDELAIERLSVSIPAKVSAGLQRFARQVGVPIKAALLAAHMKVLSFLIGEQDVVTGLLYNGRPEAMDGDRALGLFLNALPMRVSLHSETWAELARAVFEAEQEALPFRLYPLAEIQRQCGGQPLFDLAFNFTHFHVYQSLRELGGIEVLGGYASDQTFFDLTVQFNLDYAESTVSLAVDYRADKFSRDQMIAMGGYYQRALDEMIADPNSSILTSLLSAQEKEQILFRWNDTAMSYEDTLCLHELVEDQAARTPGHIALVFENQSMTYQELNDRANQVAHHLIGLNIGPGALAGIYMERSIDMVVSLLGVLKAGGAYVPLDPSYPNERLAFMIEDAKLKVILTTKDSAPDLPTPDVQTVILDAETAITLQPCTNPSHRAIPNDLAYVIYTSGSTGVPKGVQIQHRAVVNFLQSMRREPGFTDADTLLAVTTLSFDIAALEIFLPLITGAKVVIATRATATNGYELSDAISKSGATVMQATPTTWRILLEAGWNGKAGFTILCGGEALPQELASRLLEKGGAVWNLYGPTETTIWSTVCRLESPDESVTVGRPIANTQVYLLDKSLAPVPVGTPGELYIGGRGLSSGYLNRADLTAEKFIPDPFAAAPDNLVYRTGDIARYLPDGRIEMLGRADQQVKIRGYRIEPAEIEAVMQRHPAIEQSAVIAVENDDKSKRLVAYLVFAQGMSLPAAEIRNFLRQHLPKHAIPVSFVALDSMPLTPNGKVDRNKLPLTKASQELPKETEELLRMIEGLSADEVRALLSRKKSGAAEMLSS